MKRTALLSIIILIAASLSAQPKYEVRAVWLTTIGGIDWPHGYAQDAYGIIRQKKELTTMLDRLQQAGVNTVLLQTRVRATTIYPSELEPWDGCLSGKPGRSPGYDALQYALDECHRRGMELHAWVVTIPVGKWNTYGCQQLRKRYPSLIKKIGEEGYMNPEQPGTADYLANICQEITQRYDIDGIHLDYIRYPETWKGKKQAHYVTSIVRTISRRVKSYKPWVKISCSPIGKYDDLSRYSSRGWNARSQVAQDAQGWLRDGLMDQLYPMMYFQGNNFYPFAIDWHENSYGRTIVSGLGVYMLHPAERNWPMAEVMRQLNVTRQIGMGHCYFRAKFLLDDIKGVYKFVSAFDRQPSLIPPMTWESAVPPTRPAWINVNRTRHGDILSWGEAKDRSNGPYILYNVYASEKLPVDVNDPANLVATRVTSRQLSFAKALQSSNAVPARYYAITAIDRYGNESEPTVEETRKHVVHSAILMPNDGKSLSVHSTTDAEYLAVYTLQGNIVHTCVNQPKIDIRSIKDGFYELRTLNRKGVSHRLGHFIIKR